MTNIYYKKKTILSVFFAIALFLVFFGGKVTAQTSSSILPKIRIDEMSAENKNNEYVDGVLKISNLERNIIPEYYLVIELNKQVNNTSTERITKTILGPLNLDSKEIKQLPYKIDLPKKINSGNYFLKVTAKSITGIDISTKMKGLDKLSGSDSFLEIYWQDAKIIKDGNLEGPLTGVNFQPTDTITLSVKAKNPHNETIWAIPYIEIYERTDIGKSEPLITYSLEAVEFSPGFTKMFKVNLQPLDKPESYYILFKMKNEEQEIVASYQEFRVVIIGNDSAKILSSKFNKQTNEYILSLIGPADGSTTKSPTIKIIAMSGKTEYFKNELKVESLGSRTKEVIFNVKSNLAIPDNLNIKTEIYSKSGKILDTHTEDIAINTALVENKTDETKSSFNWFLVIFIILFAIIISMLIYLKKRTNLVMILVIICSSLFFSPRIVASCWQVSDDESCADYGQPDLANPSYNDSGADGGTFAIGTGPDITMSSGGINYSCSNNSSSSNVNLNCTGNTIAVSSMNDGTTAQVTCQCTAPGPGGATGTASSSLSANCWACENSETYSWSWTCEDEGRQIPGDTPGVPPVVPPVSTPGQPYNPNWPPDQPLPPNWPPDQPVPPNWPPDQPWPTNRPLPTSAPTPTPNYIKTAFPTNAPGSKAPGSIVVQNGQTWRCLKSSLENADEHKLKLTGEGFLDGDVFLVGCLLTSTSSVCTTGSDENDLKIGLGSGNYTRISQSISPPLPYFFSTEPNTLKVTDGVLEAKVFSQSAEATTHFFYGVNLNSNIIDASAKTLKYNVFNFDSSMNKCTSVRWDPTGYVFDGNTYQPISDVTLTLLDENKNMIISPGIPSTIIPDNQGKFDFYIEPGIYYLRANLKDGYTTAYGNNLIRFEELINQPAQINIPIYRR